MQGAVPPARRETNSSGWAPARRRSQGNDARHRGVLVFSDSHLRGPLALRFALNGDLLAANGDAVNTSPY